MTECEGGPEGLVNSFSLVAYIPEPLRSFLDGLRLELAPNSLAQAHITILPPRALEVSPETAWRQIEPVVRGFPVFEITPTEVEVFEASPVIYIGVGAGWTELIRLHELLNTGQLESAEQLPYHPHITVAQELTRDRLEELSEVAQQRWGEYHHRSPFRVDSVTFEQATAGNWWVDLARCSLGRG